MMKEIISSLRRIRILRPCWIWRRSKWICRPIGGIRRSMWLGRSDEGKHRRKEGFERFVKRNCTVLMERKLKECLIFSIYLFEAFSFLFSLIAFKLFTFSYFSYFSFLFLHIYPNYIVIFSSPHKYKQFVLCWGLNLRSQKSSLRPVVPNLLTPKSRIHLIWNSISHLSSLDKSGLRFN